ncbi:uncharacterized protein METZ01_LOCUS7365 [marine metagenome]|uniref:Phytanoyl-CoA dioxygenase n=1 Tax=marine metagenome TaxID=408172 RepID=A0A381NJ10_9ZZZZ
MSRIKHNLGTDGFCFLPKIFSSDQVECARNALWDVIQGQYETGVQPENRFWNVGDDPKSIIKIDKPHLCNEQIWNLITYKDFGKWLADAVGAKKIQVWHSQSVWKPAGGGQKGNAGWHRDIQYWPFWKPNGVFTAWIALSDVIEESGPVRYIRGSNEWENIPGMDFFDKNIASQDRILERTHDGFKVVSTNIEKGQISIHTSRVYHSSGPNISKGPRIGMVVHFCTDSSEKIPVKGELTSYLNQTENESICPVIYEN